MQRLWALVAAVAFLFAAPAFAQNAPGGSAGGQSATSVQGSSPDGSTPDGSAPSGLDAYGQADPNAPPPPPNYMGLLIGGLAVGGIVTGVVLGTQNNNSTGVTPASTPVSP